MFGKKKLFKNNFLKNNLKNKKNYCQSMSRDSKSFITL